MKTTNSCQLSVASCQQRLILIGVLAAVMITTACSRGPQVKAASPAVGSAKPEVVQTAAHVTAKYDPASAGKIADADRKPVSAVDQSHPTKTALGGAPTVSKLVTYRSRDYGVSFTYPWQYTFRNARTVAGVSASLRPKSDGNDGQFTLARIDIPRGFYPDTDFESGYFALSFNQALDEQQCESAFGKGAKSESINGVELRWVESESGGRGSAEKVRNYTAFSNGTCYELELGVKTSNQDGFARELDPDQVLRRLDGILRTVKIAPAMKEASAEAEAAPVVQDMRP